MLDNSSPPAICTVASSRRCRWPVTKDTSSRRMLSMLLQLHKSRLSAVCDTEVTVIIITIIKNVLISHDVHCSGAVHDQYAFKKVL